MDVRNDVSEVPSLFHKKLLIKAQLFPLETTHRSLNFLISYVTSSKSKAMNHNLALI